LNQNNKSRDQIEIKIMTFNVTCDIVIIMTHDVDLTYDNFLFLKRHESTLDASLTKY